MNVTVGLIGNPNCGKTTIFNALTGGRQRVGNWPGVTVEQKTGFFVEQGMTVNVVDLPGTYSLTTVNESSSIDERIACDYILNQHADLLINILDANNLERNLYLTMQLIEMRVPMIVAVNMMDVAEHRGLKILVKKLANELGCVVVPLSAHKNIGIQALKQAVLSLDVAGSPRLSASQPRDDGVPGSLESSSLRAHVFCGRGNPEISDDVALASAINILQGSLKNSSLDVALTVNTEWLAIRLLEDDVYVKSLVDQSIMPLVFEQQNIIRSTLHEDPDILLADARYRHIQTILQKCLQKNSVSRTSWTSRLDNIILNRVLGIPIFLSIMYCMFFFSINIGGALQDFFDISSDTIFVQGGEYLFTHLGFPSWLTALLADGVGKGINTTITFIPVIGAMFLFLAFLEDSGYMARAAFVVDRLMRALGLPGKSFVPMIVGFGCNVPAVMATRTLENKRDRILTVMMSPFMSCGARLAIYAVFTAAFFPVGGQNIVFMLYLIGIIMAMLTGFLLRKTVLKGDPAPLVMELPPYHLPNVKTVLLHAWQRLKGFVFRAGKLIVPICILIGALNAWNLDGSISGSDGSANSVLSAIGRAVTPIFAPMGIHQDNWPATVGLVTGVLAKEVVVGTLNTLYSQVGHLASIQATDFHFWGGLREAVSSIATNVSQLGHSFSNPVLAKAPVHTLSQNVYGMMYERFGGQINAIAYLLFVLLYFPCVSTTAAMLREVHRGWAIFSIIWTTGLAWCVAVGFYQTATFLQHPQVSFYWLTFVGGILLLTVLGVRAYAGTNQSVSMEAA